MMASLAKHLLGGAAALALGLAPARAGTYLDSNGGIAPPFVPLAGCPTGGGTCAGPNGPSNPFYVSGSFSLNPFLPGGAWANIASVTTTSSRVQLPAGVAVVVYNTGSSPIAVALGGSGVTAAATAGDIIQPNSAASFNVGTATYLAAAALSGSSSLVVSGGSGLADGWGNGGTVNQGTPGASPWFTQDNNAAAAIAALGCTAPCPVAPLGDQLTYEAFGGTGNATLTATAVALAASAANFMRVECLNFNASVAYLQLFNAATTGAVTLGTTVPAKIIACPPGNGVNPGVYDHEYNGVKFTAGIVVAATTTPTGSTAPTTNLSASLGYKLGN